MTRHQFWSGQGWVDRLPIPVVDPAPVDPVDPGGGGGLRDYFLEPFTATSPLVIPLPQEVAFEPETSPTTVSLRSGLAVNNGGFWVNQPSYSHTMIRATTSDPLVSVTDRTDTSRSFGTDAGVRIPVGAIAASGTDGHLCVMQPGSTYAIELISAREVSPGAWSVSRNAFVDYAGDGLGPRDTRHVFTGGKYPSRAGNGCRATGFSQMASLIRKHEVDRILQWRADYIAGRNPSPVGIIPHPLPIGCRPDQLKFEPVAGQFGWGYHTGGATKADEQIGWPVGMPRAGFALNITRHPGSEYDSGAAYEGTGKYTGQVPMSTIVGIPAATDIYAGVLDPVEIVLGQAAKDYGGIVMDRSQDAVIYLEIGSDIILRNILIENTNGSLTPNRYQARPVRRLFQKMRVVTGHAWDRPGGQPATAPRRRPLAAPLNV